MADDDEDDELLGPGPTGPPATGSANPFSPTGSQAGGITLSQQDMMLMMRQMMDATTAASRAAEAAVAVANASAESKKQGIGASDLAFCPSQTFLSHPRERKNTAHGFSGFGALSSTFVHWTRGSVMNLRTSKVVH